MFEVININSRKIAINFFAIDKIRRLSNEFEDTLQKIAPNKYKAPSFVNVPDEIEAIDIPRIIFQSEHGFSEIRIAPGVMSFEVKYSDDWKIKYEESKKYFSDRINILFHLFEEVLTDVKISFIGHSIISNFPCGKDANLIRKKIMEILEMKPSDDFKNLYEINCKLATVLGNKYFRNVTFSSNRKLNRPIRLDNRILEKDIIELGLLLQLDVNDRYAFHNIENYYSSFDESKKIITICDELLSKYATKIIGQRIDGL
jgi:hypothetical protein